MSYQYSPPQLLSGSVPKPLGNLTLQRSGTSTPTSSRFPRFNPHASSSDSEDEAGELLSQDPMLSRTRPKGLKGYLTEGGLGIYLLATNKGSKVYIGLLCAAAVATTSTSQLVNWLLFTTAGYQFPSPLTTTLTHLICAHFSLWIFAILTRMFPQLIRNVGLGVIIAPSHPVSKPPGGDNKPRSRFRIPHSLRRVCQLGSGIAGGGFFEFDYEVVKNIFMLAIVYTLKIALANLTYAHARQPTYVLLRIGIVPITAISASLLNGTWHSVTLLTVSLSGVASLLIGCIRPDVNLAWYTVIFGIASSIVEGMFPVLLINAHATLMGAIRTSTRERVDPLSTDLYHTSSVTPPGTRATYQLLQHLSLLSIAMMIPILIILIWTGVINLTLLLNLPFILQWQFWALMGCGGAATAAVLCTTILLARATSSFTVNYLSVPQSVIMVVVLSKLELGLNACLGHGLALVCSAGFWRVRVKEERSRRVM